jgi:hypothetical protein
MSDMTAKQRKDAKKKSEFKKLTFQCLETGSFPLRLCILAVKKMVLRSCSIEQIFNDSVLIQLKEKKL